MTRHITLAVQALRLWKMRQWGAALVSGAAVALLLGFVTVLIPNDVFSRDVPPVPWNYPVWIATSLLTGMLAATYVSAPGTGRAGSTGSGAAASGADEGVRSSRAGMAGTFVAWFAIGCPVCNKIALLAFGYSGALTYFAPVQPWLALVAMLLSSAALLYRLSGQVACPVRPSSRAGVPAGAGGTPSAS